MLTVMAPAKLNLTLEVLNKRPDGYHEIRSIVQTINLNDKLQFRPSPRLEFICNMPDWSFEKSLVSRAVSVLGNKTGRGAKIEIEKRIPLVAGLGGDSSDAAAVLRGLNMLWELGLSLRHLIELATQLGSDVPLFLHGGTLLVEGRGEKVTPLPPLRHMSGVLLVPPLPRPESKTERLYSMLKATDYTRGIATDSFVKWLKEGKQSVFPTMFNVFDSIAPDAFIGLRECRQRFFKAGAPEVHLAGSGPTLFTLTGDATLAENICCRLQEQKLESYVADF